MGILTFFFPRGCYMSYYVVSSGGWLKTRVLLVILQHGGLIKPSHPSLAYSCVLTVLVPQALIRALVWGRGSRLWEASWCKASAGAGFYLPGALLLAGERCSHTWVEDQPCRCSHFSHPHCRRQSGSCFPCSGWGWVPSLPV